MTDDPEDFGGLNIRPTLTEDVYARSPLHQLAIREKALHFASSIVANRILDVQKRPDLFMCLVAVIHGFLRDGMDHPTMEMLIDLSPKPKSSLH